jgi:excisionase family DNA binding protein
MSLHPQARYGRRTTTQLLTINDVAHHFAISRDSVYRLVESGALPTFRVGERMRFRVEDVEEYLQTHREASR